MKYSLILLTFIVTLLSCETKKNTDETVEIAADPKKKSLTTKITGKALEDSIIGKWINKSIRVTIKGETKDSILNVNRKNWESTLKIKPVVTVYKNDGSFISTYKSIEGKKINTVNGKWSIKKDSLILNVNGTVTSYRVRIRAEDAVFKGLLDWDEDGVADDLYVGVQKKIIKKPKAETVTK